MVLWFHKPVLDSINCTQYTLQTQEPKENIYIPIDSRVGPLFTGARCTQNEQLFLKTIYKTDMLPFVTFCRWNSRRRLDKSLGTKESLSGMKYIWCSPSSARRPCQSRRSKHSLKNRPRVWYRWGRTPARLWSSSG